MPPAGGKGRAAKRVSFKQVRSRWLLLSALAISVFMTFISLRSFPALPLQNDSVSYYEMSLYLRGENADVSLFYPPGYPAFLAALIGEVSGAAGRNLLLVQHAFRFLPLAAFFALAQLAPASLLPGLAALAFSVAPENYIFCHYMMSESLALGLMGFCLILLIWLWSKPGMVRSAAAGAAIGVLTLVRPTGAVLLLAALVPGRFMGRDGSKLRIFLAASAAWAGILAPWVAHNAAVFGTPSLTNSAGRHLFNRVVAESGLLAKRDRPEWLGWEGKERPPSYWWNYLPAIMRSGYSESQADLLFLRIAARGILANPFRYAAGTIQGSAEILFWDPVPPAGAGLYRKLEYELSVLRAEDQAAAFWQRRIPSFRALGRILADLRPSFKRRPEGEWLAGWSEVWQKGVAILKPALVIMFGAGVAWAAFTGNAAAWLAAIAVVPGLLAHGAFEIAVPRYGLPYQPLVLYLTLAGGPGIAFLGALLLRGGGDGRRRRKR